MLYYIILIMNYDIIISFILGIIISILVFVLFKNNITYNGPNSKYIKTQIFKKDNKCYMFEPKIYLCPK
jgi:hypothetical protein